VPFGNDRLPINCEVLMRLLRTVIFSLALISSGAVAQVKDSHGNLLSIGKPTTSSKDFDGGTISRGRAAKCAVDTDAPKACTFYPRNGNGSFAIDVGGLAYYAIKLSLTKIDVDYDNGARMVPLGSYTRSSRDPACWLQGASHKICVY
jgi:hypothetical protein